MARVTNARGNHPQGVCAFRVEHAGKSFVYATDTEHYEGRIDDKLARARAQDADVLIYDSQYTPEEYAGSGGTGGPKKGWGHSTFEEGVEARASGRRQASSSSSTTTRCRATPRCARRSGAPRRSSRTSIAAHEGLTLEI